jgi:hypothetical protein
MMEMPPLPEPGASRRDEDHFTEDQMRAYGESCARMAREEEREKLRALVLDDAWSLTFQTFGQYRTALAAAIRKG